MDNLFDPPQSAFLNRSLVIGVGRFGIRTLAHLWSRIRFEDDQRRELKTKLPPLAKSIGFDLILPIEGGSFIAGTPDTDNPENLNWRNDYWIHRLARNGPGLGPTIQEFLNSLSNQVYSPPVASAENSRHIFFQRAIDYSGQLGDHFVHLAEQVRIEKDAPGSETHRFTIYLVAASWEANATAMLWPLAMILRQWLEPLLPLQLIGLLSTGLYCRQEVLRNLSAQTHAALCELDFFSNVYPEDDYSEISKLSEWRQKTFFDRCYLLDSEKSNLTRPAGEEEVLVSISNMLETQLISNAPDVLDENIGPDDDLLKTKKIPFSTFGTSCVYIPIADWRAQDRDQYILEILRQQFLREEENLQENIQSETDPLSKEILSIENHVRKLVAGSPIDLLEKGNRSQASGSVSMFMKMAGEDRPLGGEGPPIPMPQVRVSPNHASTRITYSEADPANQRQRRLPAEEWVRYLYHHFQRLGLDSLDTYFPMDLVADERQRREEERAASQTSNPQPLFDRWQQNIQQAADASSASPPQNRSDIPTLKVAIEEAHGIVPDTRRIVKSCLARVIRSHNQGLLTAIGIINGLQKNLADQTAQLIDYRLRLERTGSSGSWGEFSEKTRRDLGHFENLLFNRPRWPGLLSRGVLLTSLTALLLRLGVPVLFPAAYVPYLPWLALVVGAVLSTAISLLIWWISQSRLRRAIRFFENDLVQLFNFQVNDMLAQKMVSRQARANGQPEDGQASQNAEELAGVLPELKDILDRFDTLLKHNFAGLTDERDQLEKTLSPLQSESVLARRPLPGLEGIKQRLMDAAHAGRTKEPFPENLLETPPYREVISKKVEEKLEADLKEVENPQTGIPKAEVSRLIVDTINTWIEDHYQLIIPPGDVKIEEQISGKSRELNSFLATMRAHATPLIYWNEDELPKSYPIRLELLAIDRPNFSPKIASMAKSNRIQLVATCDPFSITYLNLIHGLKISGIPHFHVYKQQFINMGEDRKDIYLLGQNYDLEDTGQDYMCEEKVKAFLKRDNQPPFSPEQ